MTTTMTRLPDLDRTEDNPAGFDPVMVGTEWEYVAAEALAGAEGAAPLIKWMGHRLVNRVLLGIHPKEDIEDGLRWLEEVEEQSPGLGLSCAVDQEAPKDLLVESYARFIAIHAGQFALNELEDRDQAASDRFRRHQAYFEHGDQTARSWSREFYLSP